MFQASFTCLGGKMKIKRTLDVALIKALTGRAIRDCSGKILIFNCGYPEDALEKIIGAANTYNPDILVAPEFMLYDCRSIISEEEKKKIEKKIAREAKRKDMLIIPGTAMWHDAKEGLIARNTAPVISDGKVIGEYSKATDGGSRKIANNHSYRYMPGENNGLIIPWNGLDIGLEICLDHDYGALKRKGRMVDIHIVPSCGMNHFWKNNCSKEGGYFIICDGHDGYSNVVLQRKGKKFELISPIDETSGIGIYRIGVEVEE